jgi:hypothetical protein
LDFEGFVYEIYGEVFEDGFLFKRNAANDLHCACSFSWDLDMQMR